MQAVGSSLPLQSVVMEIICSSEVVRLAHEQSMLTEKDKNSSGLIFFIIVLKPSMRPNLNRRCQRRWLCLSICRLKRHFTTSNRSSQPISRHSSSQFAVVPLNPRRTIAHLPAQREGVSVSRSSVSKVPTPQLSCKTTHLSSCYCTINLHCCCLRTLALQQVNVHLCTEVAAVELFHHLHAGPRVACQGQQVNLATVQ